MVIGPPAARPVARPVLLMVATVVSDEVQVTSPVISRDEPSLKKPSAVNCWVVPAAMEVLAGFTMTPLIATDPAQVVSDAVKDIRRNICKTNLKFLMRRTLAKERLGMSCVMPDLRD